MARRPSARCAHPELRCVALLGIAIVKSVDIVFDADVRQLLDGGAKLLHVACDHHSIVAGVKPADRIIKDTSEASAINSLPFHVSTWLIVSKPYATQTSI